MAHQFNLKAIVASNYLEVFDFIARFTPIAITLDVKLPDTSGWKVLDLLRNDLNFRHIPIHLISGEENRELALKRGARSFLLKPLENDALKDLFEDIVSFSKKEVRKTLVVEDNEADSSQIVKMLQGDRIEVVLSETGAKALEQSEMDSFDCIIMDYSLPDISGQLLLEKLSERKRKLTPVIIYS